MQYSDDNIDFLYNIIVAGDSGVGKSSLINRFVRNDFRLHTKPTIGVDFSSKDISYDGKRILGKIWDTAGQERFQAITPSFYRGAHGAMIVFDLSNRNTFEKVEDKWISQLRKYGEPNCIIILVGNKSDLVDQRQISVEEASQFAQKHGAYYMETSALNASNVELAFSTLMQNIYNNKPLHPVVVDPVNPPLTVVPPPVTFDPTKPPATPATNQPNKCQC
ncbi:hypothetical protein C9374_006821 [Naegleria lovaniensis]|uniref:Rab family small GTPase n=1 Tax=Naegleria lovaniensis TaxID=51637 RepID=A0AA88GYG7_NAELO|nr:uncharacterized protein C9374_006821 [Naegleria lovaniensis]KAG2393290.1 hypothetical protein C9374_006821 [Naegleria lovaniensis]